MSVRNDTPSILAQVRALCAAHPTAHKVVFTPRVQLGQAIEAAVARRTGGWAGLTCCLPIHYAQRVAQWQILSSGRRELPADGLRLVSTQFLEELRGTPVMEGLPEPQHFSRAMSRSLDTLRHRGAKLEDVKRQAARPEASQSFRLVAACYERYLDYLSHEQLYDQADVLRLATDHVHRSAPDDVAATVFAVCDETELQELDAAWLAALRGCGRAFYRLGTRASEHAPERAAAKLFPSADLPPGLSAATPGQAVDVRVRRAVGAENEVRAVMREILASGVPLDEVEIAYAASTPYLALISDYAEQLGLSVALGTGLPALQSRTGQALRGFYEWMQQDFDAKTLIRLLRSGLLRTDRARGDDKPPRETHDGVAGQREKAQLSVDAPPAHELATTLAARRYERGRWGIEKALRTACADLEEVTRRSADTSDRAAQQQVTYRRLRHAHTLLEELLDLVPEQTDVPSLARASQRFLQRFGPIDPAGSTPEEERSFEEAAHNALYEKLRKVAQLPVAFSCSAAMAAATLQQLMEEQYAPPFRPRPGHVHVLPLESAGYTGRQCVYVVGMDNETLGQTATDDAPLGDVGRMAFNAERHGSEEAKEPAGDAAVWRAGRALQRHRGTLTLYSSIYAVADGERRFPGVFFHDAEQAADDASPLLGFVPSASDLALDERDSWLGAYAAAETGSTGAARHELAEAHSWLLQGEQARANAAAATYTPHDGMLARHLCKAFDFTQPGYEGALMSAGRLEMFAESPYLYFLKYILEITPLEEPALDEEPWLDPLRRGNILHRTFERFMQRLTRWPVTPEDEPLLLEVLEGELEAECRRMAPPDKRTRASAHRMLAADARVFLYAEVKSAAQAEPLHHEVSFGYASGREKDGAYGPATLPLGNGRRILLRGRIDRVDRLRDGTLAVWDYKTGSAKDYNEAALLQDGAHLQWALYAYALGVLTGETVGRSGYYFTTTREMGWRAAGVPEEVRSDICTLLERLGDMASDGCFPMSPKAHETNGWKYEGFAPIFASLKERAGQVKAKAYPEDRARPLFMGD